jgi:hypothetical protein
VESANGQCESEEYQIDRLAGGPDLALAVGAQLTNLAEIIASPLAHNVTS